MLIQVGYEIAFSCPEPNAMVLMLNLHPSRGPTIRTHERLVTSCASRSRGSSKLRQSLRSCRRAGRTRDVPQRGRRGRLWATRHPGLGSASTGGARAAGFGAALLLASRYCEVDSELKQIAWALFGHTAPGWPRVQAICNFVHRHIRFDYNQCGPIALPWRFSASVPVSVATICTWPSPFAGA